MPYNNESSQPKVARKRFWMCWVDKGRFPTFQHWTLEDARTEATRLARLTNKDVYLLEATDFVRVAQEPQPPVTWDRTENITEEVIKD